MNKRQEKTVGEIHAMLRHLVIKELVGHRNKTLEDGGNFIDEDIKWQMVRERLGLNELLPDISDIIGTKIVIHGGLELPDFRPEKSGEGNHEK